VSEGLARGLLEGVVTISGLQGMQEQTPASSTSQCLGSQQRGKTFSMKKRGSRVICNQIR
jgi:hypothetical protein